MYCLKRQPVLCSLLLSSFAIHPKQCKISNENHCSCLNFLLDHIQIKLNVVCETDSTVHTSCAVCNSCKFVQLLFFTRIYRQLTWYFFNFKIVLLISQNSVII